MGERADEITSYNGEGYDPDKYSIVSSGTNSTTGDDDQATEAIRADIDSTRVELSDTINAIQEKLNPQQLMEQAKSTILETASEVIDKAKDSVSETVDHVKDSTKEAAVEAVDHAKQTVHDATVGKVEHMVSNISEAAQDTGSGIVDTVKKNPIPAALIGLGLGWLFMKGQNKPSNSTSRYTNQPGSYAYPNDLRSMPYRNYDSPSVRQSSGSEGISDRVMDTVRQNPLPAALTGLGIGYMVMQGQNSGKQTGRYSSYESQYGQQDLGQKVGSIAGKAGDKVGDIASGVGDTVGGVTQKAGEVVGKAGEKVGDTIGGVGNTVGQVAGSVGELAGEVAGGVGDTIGGVASGVGDTISGVATGVQYQAQQAQTQFGRMLEETPLAVGAVALALGVTVGLLLPNTPQENALLGEVRENFVEKAQEVAQQTFEKVQHVTEEVGNTARSAVEDIANTAKEEAHNQGLAK